MRIAADDEYRSNRRTCREPPRERLNLRQSAKTSGRNMLRSHFLALKENKIVPPGRSHLLRQLQEIQRNRKVHLRKAPDFETAYAQQNSRREPQPEKLQSIFLSVHSSGEDKNQVGAPQVIRRRKPGAQTRQVLIEIFQA